MADRVRYEIDGGVAVVTIDNPPVNALSPEVWDGIDAAVARANADPAAEAIVLIGAGTTFIAGADIRMFDALKTREASLSRSAHTHAMLKRIEDSAKPLVAAIHGNALGGGLEVAMACHYRVATADAKVGQPEVLLGIIPGAGGTQRFTRAVGKAVAMDVILSGRTLSAREALDAGLVARVVAREAWLEEAKRVAREIASKGPVATRLAKEAVDRAYEGPLSLGLEYERRLLYLAFASDDAREGLTAFVEKRKPDFEGR
jgi:enoyl-CoA hydratase